MTQLLTWHDLLDQEKTLPYFKNTLSLIAKERIEGVVIYPKQKDVFNAFRLTEFHTVNVVILGQDPYYRPGQAHGLAFSVLPGSPLTPSLINIYKELSFDIPGFVIPKHGCLQSWARQGVFMLNTVLTVKEGEPNSHAGLGWETFTDKVINTLSIYREKVVFLLWGAHAKEKSHLIDEKRHYILKTSHPSPLSAHHGFLGCHHFSKTNILLARQGLPSINWQP